GWTWHQPDPRSAQARGNPGRCSRTGPRAWPGGRDPLGWGMLPALQYLRGGGAVSMLRSLLVAVAVFLSIMAPALAQDFDTKAPFAVLMDYQSGTVLYQKNADERLEPASMTKLMTLAVVFDEI